MQILKASNEHLTPLVPLFDAYRVFYKKESDLVRAENFLQERLHKQDSVIYVAKHDDGKLYGFVQLYPLFSSTRMERTWLLNDLYVSAEKRGKGISIQLIDQCKSFARETNAAGISLETEKNNIVGNQLYPKTDFQLDTDHNYYFWENKK